MSVIYIIEKDNLLVKETKLDNTISINTVINLNDETINYNCKNLICQSFDYKNLDESDIYTFKSFMDDINKLDNFDDIMKKVLKMNYFKNIYLPFKASVFTTPYNKFIGYFFIFSTLFVKYQMIDLELISKPQYSDEIKKIFFLKNSKIIYYFKKIIRYILILPGLIITPFILISTMLALRNLS